MKVLVLGAGKMVEAILEGLKNETDLTQFYIYSLSGKSAKDLAFRVGAKAVTSVEEVESPNYVWIGCKPQQLETLAQSIQNKFPEATFVSMLAALPEAQQLKILGVSKLIRIMPNLPVRFKKGITLVSTASAKAELKHVVNLFSSLGVSREVQEAELEELTLLTGSGPALFYEFTKFLSRSFSSLTEAEREELARMVLLGAATSADLSDEPLDQLISSVTSKAGVTIAVLDKWRELKMSELVSNGVEAGKKRSHVIGQSFK